MKIVTENRKARFNYHLEDKMEAGVELFGWEVKSARLGAVNLAESFVRFQPKPQKVQTEPSKIKEGSVQPRGAVEAWIKNSHFSKYKNSPDRDQDPTRDRRLLLKRSQIEKLHKAVTTKGVTCIVTKLYFTNRGLLKAEIAIARGKQLHDKKQALKERDIERAMQRGE